LADDWPIVVVLDHPAIPKISLAPEKDALFISLNDWLGLHQMIRSTIGIIDYVRRALASGIDVLLGEESQRYEQLAAADAKWAGEIPTGVPALPYSPLGPSERLAAAFFDELIEKVADPNGSTGWHPEDYLRIVEQLDQVAILMRVHVGEKMIAAFGSMVEARSIKSFWVGDRESGARLCFLYDYFDAEFHGQDGEHFENWIRYYGLFRHHQAVDAGADPEIPTLAVGVLHSPANGSRNVYVFLQGLNQPQLPADVTAFCEAQFGILTGDAVIAPRIQQC